MDEGPLGSTTTPSMKRLAEKKSHKIKETNSGIEATATRGCQDRGSRRV